MVLRVVVTGVWNSLDRPCWLIRPPFSCRETPHTCSPHTTTMASQLVQDKIKSKKVMVFSKSYCPFCTKAKDVLKKYLDSGELSADDYEVLEMENRPDCNQLQDELRNITGARSVSEPWIRVQYRLRLLVTVATATDSESTGISLVLFGVVVVAYVVIARVASPHRCTRSLHVIDPHSWQTS